MRCRLVVLGLCLGIAMACGGGHKSRKSPAKELTPDAGGSAAEPDAYVNRQYQYARRPAPAGALWSKVGSAWLDI